MLAKKDIHTGFCVIGAGMAGICAAIAAAREGAEVVLMTDRPVLGGNASSEIRMWVCGAQGKNVTETGILEEIYMENLKRNPYKLWPVFDSVLWDFVKREKNITLLANCSCMDCEMKRDSLIESVTGWQTTTQTFYRVYADVFADCSGDSILAPLTGAEFRTGRESPDEFGEKVGITGSDGKTMGNSCLIQAHKGTERVSFTPPPFAKKLTPEDLKYRRPDMNSTYENFWYLELGGDRNTIDDSEEIRDELVALAFGMWDYVKNSGEYADADFWQLDFIGFLPGKRESRRMVGKTIVTQNDIINDTHFEDTVAYGGWPLDDHDPAGFRYDGHPNISYQTTSPYAIPFRALYSANIGNLMFAGRNISMTHAAMSSSRVMATCALCGQAIGTAASVALKHSCLPDGVYREHIGELQDILMWNDCMLPHHPRVPGKLTKEAAVALNGKYVPGLENLRDGNDRENPFVCGFGDEIRCTFAEPADISEIRIVFDSDLDRTTLPGSDCEKKHMMRCNVLPDSPVMCLPSTLCSVFTVEIGFENGETETVKTIDNARRLIKIKIHENSVRYISLTVDENNSGGTGARLFSFDVR